LQPPSKRHTASSIAARPAPDQIAVGMRPS
jgi:hypothetical protein